MLVYINAVQLS